MNPRVLCRRVALWVFAFAAIFALIGCTAPRSEVLITVSSTYPRSGIAGVDRYRLRLFRRSPATSRWESRSVRGTGVFLFASSNAIGGDAGLDAGAAMRLAQEVGRHRFEPELSGDMQPVLVQVEAGRVLATTEFEPTGTPVTAQFVFPPGSGRIELVLEDACRAVSAVGTLGPLAPYYTCLSTGSCPRFEPNCFEFGTDGGVRVRCPDEASADAGRGVCAEATVDASLPDGGASRGAAAGEVRTVSEDGCPDGRITCGEGGLWSRCVGQPLCAPGGGLLEPCCPRTALPAGCTGPGGRPFVVTPDCHAGLACSRGLCVPCGVVGAPCCEGAQCSTGQCDGEHCVCGRRLETCCPGAECERGFVCDGTRCVDCGQVLNSPCCADGRCSAGLTCTRVVAPGFPTGRCVECGHDGLPCCPDPMGTPALCGFREMCASGICGACGTTVNCCTGGQSNCSGFCINLSTDNANCGACGNACAGGRLCSSGRCACPAGLTDCGTCVNRTSDNANCGACGNVCTGGRVCNAGGCVCPAGLTFCNGSCRDMQMDNGNCGVCGRVCARSCCGGNCVDPAFSEPHCGGCNRPCANRCCASMCVNINNDERNCGGCGAVDPNWICRPIETCRDGICN